MRRQAAAGHAGPPAPQAAAPRGAWQGCDDGECNAKGLEEQGSSAAAAASHQRREGRRRPQQCSSGRPPCAVAKQAEQGSVKSGLPANAQAADRPALPPACAPACGWRSPRGAPWRRAAAVRQPAACHAMPCHAWRAAAAAHSQRRAGRAERVRGRVTGGTAHFGSWPAPSAMTKGCISAACTAAWTPSSLHRRRATAEEGGGPPADIANGLPPAWGDPMEPGMRSSSAGRHAGGRVWEGGAPCWP